ncbi:hypothetical protein FBEOM_1740 [Fusarium beomiforme]|uniref:Uncharacterized protein n=1 Tax=Fusarium beomiforme TaxID=44412 RepID=A0A9P5ASU6_9HYPO|nr:hypothetical protein FBEOM_1740 [Fusarium beomiforme]
MNPDILEGFAAHSGNVNVFSFAALVRSQRFTRTMLDHDIEHSERLYTSVAYACSSWDPGADNLPSKGRQEVLNEAPVPDCGDKNPNESVIFRD